MGLDSYLYRTKRCGDTTFKQVLAVENYLDWKDAQASGSKYADCTFEQWCGFSECDLPSQEVFDFYEKLNIERFYSWDVEKKYPRKRIIEMIGDWRKANQIHNWFVNNVQDGNDDCGIYKVSKDQLEDLLDICKVVIDSCELVPGKVANGQTLKNGIWCDTMEDGLTVKDGSIANKLLPPTRGFFFGSYNIDEWYVRDVERTIEIIEKVLEETDFNTQMIAYASSW